MISEQQKWLGSIFVAKGRFYGYENLDPDIRCKVDLEPIMVDR